MTKKKRWLSKADNCDICHEPLNWCLNKQWFIDGRTEYGPWALMCPRCFEKNGVGLGIGKGQKYDVVSKEKNPKSS